MDIKWIKGLFVALVTCWSTSALSAVEGFYGPITGLLTDNELFGNCMLRSTYVSSINCPNKWVSIDCKGSYNSKENARRMWDVVLMTRALESQVYVVVNDAKKHNGYCVAERVDNYQ